MSWSSYIDNLLASGNVKKAAICGHDGSLWAASEGFSVSPDEAKNLLTAFSNNSALTQSGNGTSQSQPSAHLHPTFEYVSVCIINRKIIMSTFYS